MGLPVAFRLPLPMFGHEPRALGDRSTRAIDRPLEDRRDDCDDDPEADEYDDPPRHTITVSVDIHHIAIVRNMSEYQITYWRDFPSLVSARDGDDTAKASLPQRFQEAIDEAAMRAGATDADAYLDGWRRGEWIQTDGTPSDVAERIASEIETELSQERLDTLLDELGPTTAGA